MLNRKRLPVVNQRSEGVIRDAIIENDHELEYAEQEKIMTKMSSSITCSKVAQ